MLQRVFNSFFGGIYSANLHHGHSRAISSAAIVTAAWLSFVGITLAMCVVALTGVLDHLPEFVVPITGLILFGVAWIWVVRRGDRALNGPRFDLDSFIKKRAFGIGCIALPLLFVLIARALATGSLT